MAIYHRKIIRIRAEDSPNVQRGLHQRANGLIADNAIVTPGVLTLAEYDKRRKLWDKVKQCIGLDAQFYLGAELLLFPPDWLNAAEERYDMLKGIKRKARAIGIDPAEGGDKTSMCAVDEFGVVELVSRRTPNTSVITSEAIAFGKRHDVPPEYWVFDRGGGGKQHADRLREQGYEVRTVAFGESLLLEQRYRQAFVPEKRENREERYAYVNRRAELYGELSLWFDPSVDDAPRCAIPRNCMGNDADPDSELRHQLAPIPKQYDAEGRLKLMPKNNPANPDDQRTLIKLIGHSPDEADSFALARWGMSNKPINVTVGAAWSVG